MSDLPKFYLFRRNNGIYYIGYYEQGHKRWKSTRRSCKSDALKSITNFRKLLEPKRPVIRLSEFKERFQTYAEVNYMKGTVAIFRWALNELLRQVGNCPLSSLTPEHVDGYKVKRLKAVPTLSPATVNIELRMLRSAFNYAIRWRLLETNPFSGVKQVKTPDTPPCFFTKAEFQKLLAVVKEDWLKEVIVFAVLTGLRRGEIVNLRWQDIDLSRKVINVQSSPTFRTKHGKSRAVPMSETLHNILSAKAGKSVSEYVFTLNGRKILDRWVSHNFKYYVYDLRLKDERLHFHSLRHTFANWLVQDGASLYEVQKLLGHSSSKVTEVCSHLQPEQLHSTVNRIEVALI